MSSPRQSWQQLTTVACNPHHVYVPCSHEYMQAHGVKVHIIDTFVIMNPYLNGSRGPHGAMVPSMVTTHF
eukprot:1153572-Pelagomonas_calceolata.AAC.3